MLQEKVTQKLYLINTGVEFDITQHTHFSVLDVETAVTAYPNL